ncbi:hypothetical protein FNF29_08137 [Cafeteria roenbergensis]|uniref:Cadherin domain-containing protein n=1 Tax=Cafeteria roenbergensis TaxID=33653 RepID=A0A5A8BZW2_CAFRO|nr:hypothetical protein FNF29_08137 [Cafeteria roenbergensis]|eukprot:KAA0146322.1 hypothetical protein FNF29_08137 [Cafeteria roenbergensis]
MLSADGAVEVRQAGIDFETSAKAQLARSGVTDKAGLSAESQLHISVADVNEAPVICPTSAEACPRTRHRLLAALPLVAADVDAEGHPVQLAFAFSIVSSSAPGAFAIDPTSVCSRRRLLQSWTTGCPEAVVRVRVTDSSGATGEAAITVMVTDVNEAPTFAHTSYSFQVAENANFQEEVDIVSAADPDKADTLRFTLRVDSAPKAGMHLISAINPSQARSS